ncbi:hypothetical protein EIP86_006633 [Pleurotus ostreatoroseus]|nr:hypothetical protein EIP86_006633 [Pleurotus ostreatoroseus]
MQPSAPPASLASYCVRALSFAVDASRIYDGLASLVPTSQPSAETSEYSPHAFKSVPTLRDVLFGLALPLRPPRSPLAAFLWRKRVWLECTFALTMLQPWEKFIVWILMYGFMLVLLVCTSWVVPDACAHIATGLGKLSALPLVDTRI